jgi:Leucine-rich repeat (LRR) protein
VPTLPLLTPRRFRASGHLSLLVAALACLAGAAAAQDTTPWFVLPDGQRVKLGCLPDDPAVLRAHRAPPRIGPAEALPSSVDLSAHMPPVGNQGSQGSCAAWASVYAQKTYEEGLEQGWDLTSGHHQFSPAFTYNQVRGPEGGSSLTGNLDRLILLGAPSLYDVPYNDRDDDTWPRDPQVWRRGMPYRPASWVWYPAVTDADLDVIKAILVSGHVLSLGFPVYTNFGVGADDFYEGPGPTDTTNVGHGICIVGYDDNADSGDSDGVQGGFKFQNSWGAGWGGDGRAYMSYEFIKQYVGGMILLQERGPYAPKAWAEIHIDHGCHADLTVDLGSLSGLGWLTPFAHTGQRDSTGDDDDIVAGIDITDGLAGLPPSADNPWFLQVRDDVAGQTGQIDGLVIHNETTGETWTSTSAAVPIGDSTTALMWLPGVTDPVLTFDDPSLDDAVRDALAKPTGAVHFSDVISLHYLDASNRGITDLGGIEKLTGLTDLRLGGNSITDATPLAALVNLVGLDIGGSPIGTLAPLAGLRKLERLTAWSTGVSDLSPLLGLPKLRSLNVASDPLSTPSQLSSLTDLTWLDVGNVPLPSLSVLTPLTNLTGLSLWNTGVSSLTPLAGMTKLGWLSLGYDPVTSIGALAGFPNLYSVDLYHTQVTDLGPLQHLSALTWLRVDTTGLADLSPLSDLPKIQELWLVGNSISDLTPLQGLSTLTRLDLGYNQVTDITPLDGLTRLTYLGLNHNEITDAGALAGLTALGESGRTPDLNLADNRLEDIGALVDNPGLGSGETVSLERNWLDLTGGTGASDDVAALRGRGVEVLTTGNAPHTEVTLADANLERAIRAAIPKPSGPLYRSDLSSLQTLSADDTTGSDDGDDIHSLAGLEYCASLKYLYLRDNKVTDLSPLAGLAELRNLRVRGNPLAGLGPLSGLAKLDWLDASYTGTAILTPLSSLPALRTLYAESNGITDLTPLEGMTSLQWLYLARNPLPSVASLVGLTNLESLGLTSTGTADLSPLTGMTKMRWLALDGCGAVTSLGPLSRMADLDYLDIGGNQVSDLTPLTGLAKLRVLIAWTNRISSIGPLATCTNLQFLSLPYNQIADVTALGPLAKLINVDLYDNQISDLTALAGLTAIAPNWFYPQLQLGRNHIEDIGPLVDNTGLGSGDTVGLESNWLDLGEGTQASADAAALEARGVTLQKTGNTPHTLISFSDPGLETIVRAAISKPAGALYRTDVASLTSLDANDPTSGDDSDDITDLTGLQYCTGLTWLHLADNRITDLSPLAGLTTLVGLNLGGNGGITSFAPLTELTKMWWLMMPSVGISDLTPLTGMANLTWLQLAGNRITDLTPLADKPNLVWLMLYSNPSLGSLAPLSRDTALQTLNLWSAGVSDISALSDLSALTWLELSNDPVGSLTPLAGLTHLSTLWANNCGISDLSPLQDLTGLTELGFQSNSVTDVSVLEGMPHLRVLRASGNPIADFSPLARLTEMQDLNLWDTHLTDISFAANMPGLQWLWLGYNSVRDVGALRDLPSLKSVDLHYNQVGDIADLAANAGLGSGDSLDVRYNWLDTSAGSPTSACIQALSNRGVTVSYNDQTPQAAVTLPAGWVMLSVPRNANTGTYEGVFGDDFVMANCVLYRWAPGARQYSALTPLGVLGAGEGFWFSGPGGNLDVQGSQFQGDRNVALQAGWNLVAAPRECALAGLQVLHGTTQLPLGDVAQTWVSPTLYRWDNTLGRYVACTPGCGDCLAEWSGYWVLATEACSLIVPAPAVGAAETPAAGGSGPRPQWAFELEARCATTGANAADAPGTDSVTIAGATSASAGFDGLALDQPKAPLPPVPGVRAALEGPSTGAAAAWTGELDQETRNWTSPEGATYRVHLTGPSGATVSLRWPDLSALPTDASAWLVNPATGQRTYLRTQQSASVRLSDGATEGSAELEVQVRVRAAAPALVTAMSAGGRTSGRAEVAFALGADAWVTVRVLNLAGRPVATVVADRACAAGPNSAAWNLRGTSGARVPAGRYLCVLQARTEDGQTLQRTCPLSVGR